MGNITTFVEWVVENFDMDTMGDMDMGAQLKAELQDAIKKGDMAKAAKLRQFIVSMGLTPDEVGVGAGAGPSAPTAPAAPAPRMMRRMGKR